MLTKFFFLAMLLIEVNCRTVNKHLKAPIYFVDKANILEDDLEDALAEKHFESVQPGYLRKTRQAHGSTLVNPYGTYNLDTKDPLVDENGIWSTIGSISAFDNDLRKYGAVDLTVDNEYVLILIFNIL